jgi:hypothetical protein
MHHPQADDEPDQLAAARDIVISLLVSILLWVALAVTWLWNQRGG